MTPDLFERPMTQKKQMPTVMNGEGPRPFPPEAHAYDEDVDAAAVARLKDEIDIDFSDEWEMVDGFGRVIRAA